MADREIVLWLNERWYAALERHLRDQTLRDKLEDYLDELCNQLPSREYEQISREIYEERMEQEAQREAGRRFSVLRVTEQGERTCLLTEAPLELYNVATSLRRYLLTAEPAKTLRGWYSAATEISASDFLRFCRERIDGTGRVHGAYEIDLDHDWVGELAASGGWRRHDIRTVCQAAYHAMRKTTAPSQEKMQRFAERLTELEQVDACPAEYFLRGSRLLRGEDISFSDEICETEDGKLDFYLNAFDGLDEVFGTHVCTDLNEDYVNVYADYNLRRGEVADALTVVLCRGDGTEAEYAYVLTPQEKALLLPEMERYCQEQTGYSLEAYREQYLAEQQEQAGQTRSGLEMTM